jgi:hypothetical protein
MTRHPKHCLRCGSADLRDIVYGTPADPTLLHLWGDGQVMLRPRRASDGKSPGWMCAECGLETSDIKASRPLDADWRGRC